MVPPLTTQGLLQGVSLQLLQAMLPSLLLGGIRGLSCCLRLVAWISHTPLHTLSSWLPSWRASVPTGTQPHWVPSTEPSPAARGSLVPTGTFCMPLAHQRRFGPAGTLLPGHVPEAWGQAAACGLGKSGPCWGPLHAACTPRGLELSHLLRLPGSSPQAKVLQALSRAPGSFRDLLGQLLYPAGQLLPALQCPSSCPLLIFSPLKPSMLPLLSSFHPPGGWRDPIKGPEK